MTLRPSSDPSSTSVEALTATRAPSDPETAKPLAKPPAVDVDPVFTTKATAPYFPGGDTSMRLPIASFRASSTSSKRLSALDLTSLFAGSAFSSASW